MWVAPDRANVLVKPRCNPIALSLLTDANLSDLRREHESYRLQAQNLGKVGAWPAQELVGRLNSSKGTPVGQRQVIVDGGELKVTLTLSAHAQDFEAHQATFADVVASLWLDPSVCVALPD